MKKKERERSTRPSDRIGKVMRKLKAALFSPLVVTAMVCGVVAALIAVVRKRIRGGP